MGSEYRSWNAWRLTLSSSLEEMNRKAFMSIGSLILLPCQAHDARLSTLGFPPQFLCKSLAVTLVVKIQSPRLCDCLPGLGPSACVTAARVLFFSYPKGTCTLAQETRCFLARERAVAQLGSALEWGSRGRGFESRQPESRFFQRTPSP
jgi:hypothetical protein